MELVSRLVKNGKGKDPFPFGRHVLTVKGKGKSLHYEVDVDLICLPSHSSSRRV